MIGPSDQDKRRTLAVDMLVENIKTLPEMKRVLSEGVFLFDGSFFPIDLLLPGTPIFKNWQDENGGVDVAKLPSPDVLKSYVLRLQETIVVPQILAFIDGVTEQTRADLVTVQQDARGSEKIADDCFANFRQYLIDEGHPATLDDEVYQNFSIKIARRGFVYTIGNAIPHDVAQRVATQLENEWLDIVAPEATETSLVPPDVAEEDDLIRFMHFAAGALTRDAGDAVIALDVWETPEVAVGQREAWAFTVKTEGNQEAFLPLHHYIAQIRRPLSPD